MPLALCLSFAASATEPECRDELDTAKRAEAMWAQGTPKAQQALIHCVDAAWSYHDNEASPKNAHFTLDASDDLLSAMEFDLPAFVREMEGRQELLAKWLEGLEHNTFTWFDDPPCGHQAKIEKIRSSLAANKGDLGSFGSFQQLERGFQALRCHVID